MMQVEETASYVDKGVKHEIFSLSLERDSDSRSYVVIMEDFIIVLHHLTARNKVEPKRNRPLIHQSPR